MNISRGKMPGGRKFIIYGVEGIGKSTLASRFPDPVFIDTEDSTKEMDVRRFDKPTSWQMLLSEVQYIIDHPETCKTLVLDTADWAEKLEIEELCARMKWDGLEAPGYGRGYQYSAEAFGKLLDKLSEVAAKGVNVLITAHAWLRKIELPEEMGAYDHWEMKTTKKVAPMLREWADNVFFANYKTVIINVDGKGTAKGKNKAQGGKRVLYTSHNPCWDAKNRLGMPEELEMSWEAIAPFVAGDAVDGTRAGTVYQGHSLRSSGPYTSVTPYITPGGETRSVGRDVSEKTGDGSPGTATPTMAVEGPARPVEAEKPSDTGKAAKTAGAAAERPVGALGKLFDLMGAEGVTEAQVMDVVAKKGYFPRGTALSRLPEAFVEGVLVGAWPQVLQAIRQA